MLQGNHRLAALAVLGKEKVITRPKAGFFREILEENVREWHFVRNGECTVSDAMAYFDAFFSLNGTERAVALGFIQQ